MRMHFNRVIVFLCLYPLLSQNIPVKYQQNDYRGNLTDSEIQNETSSFLNGRNLQQVEEIIEYYADSEPDTCEVGTTVCTLRNISTGSKVCYRPRQKCDGIPDCPKTTEEIGCPCRSRLQSKFICDGEMDCHDYSDELGCEVCLSDELNCSDRCVSLQDFCEGSKCSQFSRPLLCSRLTADKSEKSKENFYRSYGYLQKLIRKNWLPVCGTLMVEETKAAIGDLCEAITGVRNNNYIYKHERLTSSKSHYWAVLRSHEGHVVGSRTDSCPQNMTVYVECLSPPCQNGSIVDAPNHRLKTEGGEDASLQVSSIVARITKDGQHHCVGSILSPWWILTASHCFSKVNLHRYEIEAGTYRRRTYGPSVQRRVVSHIIIHPEYDPFSLSNDIALIKLDTPLQLTRWARTPCFNEATDPAEGEICRVVAWGHQGEEKYLDTLQEIAILIRKRDHCLKDYISFDPDKNICAGYERIRNDSCHGDSGGLLICYSCSQEKNQAECETRPWYQAGLVSYGRGCTVPGTGGVYTKISYYKQWIFDTIGLLEKDSSKLPAFVPKTVCDGLSCLHNSGLCLPPELVCDGKVHCLNALDEADCESSTNPTTLSSPLPDNKDETLHSDDDYNHDAPSPDPSEKATLSTTCDPREEYRCKVYPECIPNALICDEKRDCRDGTDELNCTCVDRLYLTDKRKICDFKTDCFDFTDESRSVCGDLYDICGDQGWLCQVSKHCIEVSKLCDGIPDCKYGEDEIYCLALFPMEEELIFEESRPRIFGEGLLFIFSRRSFDWTPVCESQISLQDINVICSYSGFRPPLNITYNSNLASADEIRERTNRKKRFISIPKAKHDFGFSSEGLTVNRTRIENFKEGKFAAFRNEFSILSHHGWMRPIWNRDRATREVCNQAKIECGERICGTVRSLHFSRAPPLDDVSHVPWGVSIFHSGVYLCGGTIVGMQWAITSQRCLANVNLNNSELYIMGGSSTGLLTSKYLGPNDAILRVDSISPVDSAADVALLHLERKIKNIEQLNEVCLNDYKNSVWKECIVVGRWKNRLNHAFLLIPDWRRDCHKDKICLKGFFPQGDFCVNTWAGLISCRRERSSESPWIAVAIWNFTPDEDCQLPPLSYTKITDDLKTKIQKMMDETDITVSPPLKCDSHKCPLGECLPATEVCNAKASCSDLSDEWFQCRVPINLCQGNNSTDSCDCPQNEFKCNGGICLKHDQVCDGIVHCINGEDEENCKCSELIDPTKEPQHCDGVIDCRDESDEFQCKCNLDEFRCFRSPDQACIKRSFVCDLLPDCLKGEDEGYCFTISATTSAEENSLGIPISTSSGFFLLRFKGQWITQSNESWDPSVSSAICIALGYRGARETAIKDIDSNMMILPEPLPTTITTTNFPAENFEAVFLECLN